MPAGNGEADTVFFLYADLGIYFYAFQRPGHIAKGDTVFAASREGAVVFAQMTAQTPFFVYIYPFHRFTS
jgi:hypothetical protein